MAFTKKEKVFHVDGRPKAAKSVLREQKVAALKAANNPDARKVLKRMNDVIYRGSRSNLKEWFKPKGKGLTCK